MIPTIAAARRKARNIRAKLRNTLDAQKWAIATGESVICRDPDGKILSEPFKTISNAIASILPQHKSELFEFNPEPPPLAETLDETITHLENEIRRAPLEDIKDELERCLHTVRAKSLVVQARARACVPAEYLRDQIRAWIREWYSRYPIGNLDLMLRQVDGVRFTNKKQHARQLGARMDTA